MEPNDNQLTSFFNHPHHILYPHSVSSQLQPPKRKRGRPRKYGTPEQPLAANNKNNNPHSSTFPSSKKSHSFPLGQGFTPHLISVAAGEDVGQKIMFFMQQSRREMCILSASGSISNASLRQPATSGGSITYEGRFEIVSLTGSYVRNELGTRTGGLSICLSSTDGQIIGGGVGGPLKAAGPVQVIVGTFFIDNKKDTGAGVKVDASASKLPSPVSEPVTSLGFRQSVDSSSRNPIHGNEEQHQAMGASHFMIQQLGLHGTPPRSTDWSCPDSNNTSFELTGRTGHEAHQSPENRGHEQITEGNIKMAFGFD